MKPGLPLRAFLLLLCLILKTGKAEPAFPLSLREAIALAIRNNLATLVAEERQHEAAGRQQEALSQLLPNFYATASQTNLTSNLAATGFPAKSLGISPLIGPYNNFDARLQLAQTLFNLSAYRRHQASQVDLRIATLQTELTREQIAAATANAYLNVLASLEAVQASKANVELAKSLVKLAGDQHDAGIATGVDVARADTQLAAKQVSFAQAVTATNQAQLQLKRLIGIPLASALSLTDSLEFKLPHPAILDSLLAQAFANRVELKIADQEVNFNNYTLQAAQGEKIPSLGFTANYGESGNTWGTLALPTRALGVHMDIPIFNGGLTEGRIVEAKSRKREAELTERDTRLQVEEDVRLALQTLQTTTDEAQSAFESLQLAERELGLARDRFAAGLSDNIEVIQAETALENARNAKVAAFADYNRARVNLASSLGQAQNFEFIKMRRTP